jgi:hypothetical protein
MAALLLTTGPPPPEAPGAEPPPTSLSWFQEDSTAGPAPAEVVEELIACVESALAFQPRFACEILEGCAVRLHHTGDNPGPSIRQCLDRARRQIGGAP